MIGSYVWNFVSGLFGMICAFIGAYLKNPLTTSLERAVYGFIIAFILMFAVRWFFAKMVGMGSGEGAESEGYNASYYTPSFSQSVPTFSAATPSGNDEMDILKRLIRDSVVGEQGESSQKGVHQSDSSQSIKPANQSTNFNNMMDQFDASTIVEPPKMVENTQFTPADLANAIRTSILDD